MALIEEKKPFIGLFSVDRGANVVVGLGDYHAYEG